MMLNGLKVLKGPEVLDSLELLQNTDASRLQNAFSCWQKQKKLPPNYCFFLFVASFRQIITAGGHFVT